MLRLWKETNDDGLFDAAAAVTFWVLLSLPALMLAMLSSVSLVGDGLANELERITLDFVDRTFADESSDIQTRSGACSTRNGPGCSACRWRSPCSRCRGGSQD